MTETLTLQLRDVSAAARAKKLRDVVGRDLELDRLARVLIRSQHHHVLIIGEPGSGRTALVEAFAHRNAQGSLPLAALPIYRLDVEPLLNLIITGGNVSGCLRALDQAVSQLPPSIIIIDNLERLATDDPYRQEFMLQLIEPLTRQPAIRLVAVASSEGYQANLQPLAAIHRIFDLIELPTPTPQQAEPMVAAHKQRYERTYSVSIDNQAIEAAATHARRFLPKRALPDSALRLLDEACAKVHLEDAEIVTSAAVTAVVAERTRVPLHTLSVAERTTLADLGLALEQRVIGQPAALTKIAATIARARLGLTDRRRPRGSFLLLGPSGVGKTETAKALAQLVFGSEQAFIRLDMSEYGEPHAGVRLVGAPPGYVGYSDGGQLTNPIAREPYSLILLDEIEKAHPRVFDLFLQVLDDGRLTDGSGQTVDFSQTFVVATSNTGVEAILHGIRSGQDIHSPEFFDTVLLPALLTTYRPEFINRFDSVLVYEPLSLNHLVEIARKQLGELIARVGHQPVLEIDDQELRALVAKIANPVLGARPVRRLIQDHFEAPLAAQLLREE